MPLSELSRPTALDFLQATATIAALDQFVAIMSMHDDPTGAVDAAVIHATRAADAIRRTWGIPTDDMLVEPTPAELAGIALLVAPALSESELRLMHGDR